MTLRVRPRPKPCDVEIGIAWQSGNAVTGTWTTETVRVQAKDDEEAERKAIEALQKQHEEPKAPPATMFGVAGYFLFNIDWNPKEI